MKKDVTKIYKGLHTDNSLQNQPQGTHRFGLNGVLESEDGDFGLVSNEESNDMCAELPEDYIPIGKEYMNNGKSVIFLVKSDETLSEIGIVDDECNYETHVNADLGFKVTNQIDVTYRLRRGCERTIYFTDDLNKPRVYNFDKPEDFKNKYKEWDIDKFNLFKIYDKIPNFKRVEINENGELPAGSYNFSIQYLDEDLNPTEWITTTDIIVIYNDNFTSKPFSEIRGSTNLKNDYQDFGLTNKAIRIFFSNLSEDFPFYRIAIIKANNGSGRINEITYSQEISTKINSYTYTGENDINKGTENEIQQFNNIIETAEHIEQIENRLVLSNVKGKQLNYCNLQKYASKIKADLVTKKIVLNNINFKNNPKRSQVNLEKTGYMPGEIYSFGIVYVFEDNSLSPVYHIPGRNKSFPSNMSKYNELTDTYYTDNSNCSDEDYWGVDCQGDALLNQKIRHHRFPFRSQVKKTLFAKDGSFSHLDLDMNGVFLNISGNLSSLYKDYYLFLYIDYDLNGIAQPLKKIRPIYIKNYDSEQGINNIFLFSEYGTISNVVVYDIDPDYYDPYDYDPDRGKRAVISADLHYETSIKKTDSSGVIFDDSYYSSEIFGISFSGIDLPSLKDTNGQKVIGYYIVRNERTEEQKTILDTCVLCPLITEEKDSKFVSHGHILPNTDNKKQDVFALIHPEHKFNNKEYKNVTELIHDGEYVINSKSVKSSIIQDVQPGTSYDKSRHKKRERDSDGFSLHVLNRNTNIDYEINNNLSIKKDEINEIFYLNALFNKTITDTDKKRKDIYNLSSDNKIGIVQLNKKLDIGNKLPYYIMKRELSNPYGNFRLLPFYKEHNNFIYFEKVEDNKIDIFNGDTYISSMKYMSSMFYDVKVRKRKEKHSFLNFIFGIVSTVFGGILAITGIGLSQGIALIGFGLTQVATGLKKEQALKVYKDLYKQGLKNTVNDKDTFEVFDPNPEDDTIQWFFDLLTNLWFESTVNMNWRMGSTIALTDFLNSPSGYNQQQSLQYCVDKVTIPDAKANDDRSYQGFAKSEIYQINPDYKRKNKEKTFFHLGLEYDCCSKCIEDFPNRIHWSEQSFQEELTDNYRTFLPNNYKDIEGSKGEITNIFRIQNNLYIHTEEALWHLPQNLQERVTNEIISFIGTGNFFNIPPRLIVDDDNGNSAGTKYKQGTLKTPNGIFFISEKERVIYKFNGNGLKPISSNGMFSWFKNNIELRLNKEHYLLNKKPYPYIDNPSNIHGIGFISTYDSRKERILFTKKDFIFHHADLSTKDYEICSKDGKITVFKDFNKIINNKKSDGWTYIGIEDCKMKFKKVIQELKKVEKSYVVYNDTDVHVFYDISGSFGSMADNCLMNIKTTVHKWKKNFKNVNPNWKGSLYEYPDRTERWVNYANVIKDNTYNGKTSNKNIIVISFCNESDDVYHDNKFTDTIKDPTMTFISDYNNFINNIYPSYKSFYGIHYPIFFPDAEPRCMGLGGIPQGGVPEGDNTNFILHSIAALQGTVMTDSDIRSVLPNKNKGFKQSDWDTLITALKKSNPYPSDGLKNYNWVGQWDRYIKENDVVINEEEFSNDINSLLNNVVSTKFEYTSFPVIQYDYVEGKVIDNIEKINNSWTMSYSIKTNSWQHWHSYLPSFYIHTPNHFHSWIQENKYLWKHNKKGNYQTFYNIKYPFIIEYVSVNNPLVTKIWDYIKFITEAKRYNEDVEEFIDERYITFDKAMFYNSTQSSGILNLLVKSHSLTDEDYLLQQVKNLKGDSIIISKNEKDWKINTLRDYRIDYSQPLFNHKLKDLQNDYYIDKVVNTDSIYYEKDWKELESFRDKYLVIRLIFNRFDDVKLLFNYSIENETPSTR